MTIYCVTQFWINFCYMKTYIKVKWKEKKNIKVKKRKTSFNFLSSAFLFSFHSFGDNDCVALTLWMFCVTPLAHDLTLLNTFSLSFVDV